MRQLNKYHPNQLKDLTNQVFGRLTVLKRDFERKSKEIVYWLCQCQCGKIISTRGDALRQGVTKSCGCLNAELLASGRNVTHGKSGTKEYISWMGMIERCCNPHNKSYARYGGAGTKICMGYRSSFENFFNDLGLKPTPEHSVDRIKNHLHYSCGKCEECKKNSWDMNVQWATYFEQNKNKGNNVWIECNGEKMIVSEWARKLNVKPNVISAYIKSGHSGVEAINRYSKPNLKRLKRNSLQDQ